ncbi:MAG: deoxyribodipyrimidine photo-lyase [Mesotoga sp.]|nr:deoxyribodipyrimidine photo-lyase [Mesotoga sp.]MDD5744022.1 deoxyribodipyrimidine photo-lyase [Mesotoga sp.]
MRREGIHKANNISSKTGRFVLYWMQASQRAVDNDALDYACEISNYLSLPLLVLFVLHGEYPSANRRSFTFMLEGLEETEKRLKERGITFLLKAGNPVDKVLEIAKNASVLVSDVGYLRHQQFWRERIAHRVESPFFVVESNVIVPVGQVSRKEEFSAATIRPKISRLLIDYPESRPVESRRLKGLGVEDFETVSLSACLKDLKFVDDVPAVSSFKGGTSQAIEMLESFLRDKIDIFCRERNDPNSDALSNMSPYLHFGQISPSYIARKITERESPCAEAYLEELIVRRELSMNFTLYNPDYDRFEGLPVWAKKTLNEHREDMREYIYSREQFESRSTHDPYWNAAQNEMALTGKMHGYMRMYWGKKILEWSESPEAALDTAVYLNDKYELDGRDPNGYAGIMWCLGKHDRAWAERKVTGKVRYMNSAGLRRKFDADGYVRRIDRLTQST